MPSNKKPRKAYRPKYAKGTLPITIRQSSDADTALQLVPHTELEKLRDGTADEYTANTMAFRLNWGYVMAGEVFDNPEVRADMELALAAIRSVKARQGTNAPANGARPGLSSFRWATASSTQTPCKWQRPGANSTRRWLSCTPSTFSRATRKKPHEQFNKLPRTGNEGDPVV